MYVADLHIHSKFSRACSQELTIANLAHWSSLKGIDLTGTGDFLHPLWFSELKAKLIESPTGIHTFEGHKFLLTNEISCIYADKGRVRRIHLLVFLPSFEAVARLAEELIKRGVNLASDGRPILGMSVKSLCEIIFSLESKAIIMGAHIWTPWFSLFGSQSGYDFFKECFGEFSDNIFAVETGLSSEPAMNWRIADLDQKSIVSFSDSHSLPRLGREVTIFKGNCTFDELRDDLIKQNIHGTIEFFPEEGKYHYSGHRNCNVVLSPAQLQKNGEICPKCGKRLTIGVINRVEDLATRSQEELRLKKENGITTSQAFPNRPGFRMLVALDQIIAESLGLASVSSQKVKDLYIKLVTNIDNELKILTKTPLDLISMVAGEKIAEGVHRVREAKLSIEPGFDNTYGKVKIWDEKDGEKAAKAQINLFDN